MVTTNAVEGHPDRDDQYDKLVCEAAGLDLTCVDATFGSDCVNLERLTWTHNGELLRGRFGVGGRD